MGMLSDSRGRKSTYHLCSPSLPHQHNHGSSHCRFCQEIFYADGGRSTHYLASDDDDAEIEGHNDSSGTRYYTFEEKDQAESSVHSLTSLKPCSSPSTPSPTTMIVPPTTVSKIGSKSPLHSPSLEV